MEQPGVVVGNFGLRFSLHFLSIFVHISGSIRLITGHHWKDLLLLQKLSILVKRDDVKSGRKAKARHGRLGPAWESMG